MQIQYFYCKFIIFIGHLLFFIGRKQILKRKKSNFLLNIYYFYWTFIFFIGRKQIFYWKVYNHPKKSLSIGSTKKVEVEKFWVEEKLHKIQGHIYCAHFDSSPLDRTKDLLLSIFVMEHCMQSNNSKSTQKPKKLLK